MISKKDFQNTAKSHDKLSKLKDEIISKSRVILRQSKEVIYLANKKSAQAGKKCAVMKKDYQALALMAAKHSTLQCSGMFKVASQEYVEAACYLGYIKNKRLLTTKEVGVTGEYYLMGVCDLTGELVRRAINQAIDNEFEDAIKIRDFVSELYTELLQINIANGELRKKFDRIKYDLQKLEDLVLNLKLKTQ